MDVKRAFQPASLAPSTAEVAGQREMLERPSPRGLEYARKVRLRGFASVATYHRSGYLTTGRRGRYPAKGIGNLTPGRIRYDGPSNACQRF